VVRFSGRGVHARAEVGIHGGIALPPTISTLHKTGKVTGISTNSTTSTTFTDFDIPSKYEIIPIHQSDRSTFKACRRKWDWTSPARHSLTVRADVSGVYKPFFFGSGIHYALEQYYQPGIRRDPVEAFRTWFSIVWDGGVVTADWLDKVYDLDPQPAPHRTITSDWVDVRQGFPGDDRVILWQVRGLRDILPEVDEAEFLELRELGCNMLANYKRYAAENDGFEVVVAEHDFSVPIWDYENDTILMRRDSREQSPNYGNMLEVHARGRMDAIAIKPNGKMIVLDHKTAERMDSELDIKLETDEQITTYLACAQIEATYYGLPHAGEPLEEAIYNVLRKAYPQPPTITKSGMFSVDRAKECTTFDAVYAWMNDAGIAYAELAEKHQGYVDWLREVGDEQFFIRKLVRRNQHQLKNAGYRIYLEAMDMLDPNVRIYPNISSHRWDCLNCAFRAPCMAIESGDDAQYMIDNNYSINKDR
jgi:hypothetical protein